MLIAVIMLIKDLLLIYFLIMIAFLIRDKMELKQELENQTILSERIALRLYKLKIANRGRNFLIYDKLNNTIHEDDFEL